MIPISNITFEKCIATGALGADYTDAQGFFFRATTAGNIKFEPVDNPDGDFLTIAVEAKNNFEDCRIAKKIYASGTTAQGIYIGKGI